MNATKTTFTRIKTNYIELYLRLTNSTKTCVAHFYREVTKDGSVDTTI